MKVPMFQLTDLNRNLHRKIQFLVIYNNSKLDKSHFILSCYTHTLLNKVVHKYLIVFSISEKLS